MPCKPRGYWHEQEVQQQNPRRDNVLLELSSSTADAGTTTFAPADHLLGIVQRIVASRDNTRIVLPGKGEIAILPGLGEYYASVQNMAEFCTAPPTQFQVSALGEAALPSTAGKRNIQELLWNAAFQASQGRLAEGCSKYDVVQFRHWPNLTRLPVTPNAARICALLTRHPTTIMLLHRMLCIDKEEVYQIYSAAYCAGIANTISRTPESANPETQVAEGQPAPAQERGIFRSLFAKISGL
jgi:hypothetical protein